MASAGYVRAGRKQPSVRTCCCKTLRMRTACLHLLILVVHVRRRTAERDMRAAMALRN